MNIFNAALVAITLLLAPTVATANVNPTQLSYAVLVSDGACEEGTSDLASVDKAIETAGISVLAKVDVEGNAAVALMAALSKFAPPPTGTDSFRIFRFGDGRVGIAALNKRCSLGVLVIPEELFTTIVQGLEGDPA